MKRKKKASFMLLFLGIFLSLTSCKASFLSDLSAAEDTFEIRRESKASVSEEKSTLAKNVYVHVCGCVKKPGLYAFYEGERIDAAIRAAGGFTKKADEQSVNLAEVLLDGTQIYVRSMQTDGSGKGQPAMDSGEQKININVADQAQLMTLNGIGEGRALAILSYREEKGSFSNIEEIKNVSGIGEAIYDRIKNTITVE
ncbi:MAG: helix-hairpin-helix domain-containing protein [Eubacteriales bacterium]|nr:helix-hairpin-helix domain-containing protein [Eubacteriales bacterium]